MQDVYIYYTMHSAFSTVSGRWHYNSIKLSRIELLIVYIISASIPNFYSPLNVSCKNTELMKFKWTQSTQRWLHSVVFVSSVNRCMTPPGHCRCGATGNVPSSITSSYCPSTRVAKSFLSCIHDSQRPQHHVWG